MDGIDVAIIRIRGAGSRIRLHLESFRTVPYPARVRRALLASCNARRISVAEISQLNFLVGELFSRAVEKTCARARIRLRSLDLIGSHGQTIYHQGSASNAHGFRVASTLQIGEPAIIAERIGVPTVADFRTADMAAGGTGAPLAPLLDYLLYRHPQRGRAALNIGGIANVTLLPPGAAPADVVRWIPVRATWYWMRWWSTSPAAAATSTATVKWRREAACARRCCAACYATRSSDSLRHAQQAREEFGREFVATLLREKLSPQDLLATATALTADSIAGAIRRFAPGPINDLVVSGGGVPQSVSHGEAGGRAAHPHSSC